ncbi:LLM class flavin-dependent oxidoreductase [Salicibibacter halophilus]|uniref:LLM class flavin-dependent oxidoreductase n=1 Tax=Salicibibacter halophilus TaxID=2502791 RepID=A0A514LE66_9BACI|nr:LLM class flavin-dependent oxidoreductase [Salicibibacter halophilus]QDI90137.1 LLM class flavin-dependent oxidoreductase [Salicibibacter halophilus]
MKLSILDQSPISSNQTAGEALNESMKLAQVGERLGYERIWMTEHHDLPGLACSAPEVMLSYIGAKTKTIRLGTGAVLLPHYKSYKVAEVHHQLATLFPGRIDLGIGRAPGGSAEVTNALNDNFLQNVYKMPDLVEELLCYLDDQIPKVSASPLPDISPTPWLLGTSAKSASLAGEHGISYVFGQFMSDEDGPTIVQKYLDAFTPRDRGQKPGIIVTISAICAETTEKAEEIALSSLIWQLQKEKGEGKQGVPSIQDAKDYPLSDKEKERFEDMKQRMIIGGPNEAKAEIKEIQTKNQANEIMIMTTTYSPQDRVRSYELIAEEVLSTDNKTLS